jgi:hypothetical protein
MKGTTTSHERYAKALRASTSDYIFIIPKFF